jgi:hypothetical protein
MVTGMVNPLQPGMRPQADVIMAAKNRLTRVISGRLSRGMNDLDGRLPCMI